ncbi:hypothetical protein [Zobellella taiwanensis]
MNDLLSLSGFILDENGATELPESDMDISVHPAWGLASGRVGAGVRRAEGKH